MAYTPQILENLFPNLYFPGHIHIPPIRIKSEQEHVNLNSNGDKRDKNLPGISTNPLNKKNSFIDEIEQYANAIQAGKNKQPTNPAPLNASNTSQKPTEFLNLNTAEILDIAHNLRTEDIEGLSSQLSDNLNFQS